MRAKGAQWGHLVMWGRKVKLEKRWVCSYKMLQLHRAILAAPVHLDCRGSQANEDHKETLGRQELWERQENRVRLEIWAKMGLMV